jgi:mono/diheme cytochrome c family protein
MIVQRGFPRPPSLFSDNLIKAKAQHFYDVITNGHGVMYSYADRVSPGDRWAIIAYIRALQRSQRAQVAGLPVQDQQMLQAEAP